ncbi:MAG: hypothetical protein WC435_02590 [Candidatus Paceibacterota bacterium]
MEKLFILHFRDRTLGLKATVYSLPSSPKFGRPKIRHILQEKPNEKNKKTECKIFSLPVESRK